MDNDVVLLVIEEDSNFMANCINIISQMNSLNEAEIFIVYLSLEVDACVHTLSLLVEGVNNKEDVLTEKEENDVVQAEEMDIINIKDRINSNDNLAKDFVHVGMANVNAMANIIDKVDDNEGYYVNINYNGWDDIKI